MATKPHARAPWGEYVPWVGRMRVEQFEQFPGEDGWTYALHDGRLVVMPGPGAEHVDIQERFFLSLGVYIREHGLGRPSGTSCYNLPLPNNSEELLCPDLSYVEPMRRSAMPLRGSYLVGAPVLVVEIASPSDSRRALAAKLAIYMQSGVRMAWVAWPATQTVDVWRPSSPAVAIVTLQGDDLLDGHDVVPGFQRPVRDIFGG